MTEPPFNFLMITSGFMLLLSNNTPTIAIGIFLLASGLFAPFYQDALLGRVRRIGKPWAHTNQTIDTPVLYADNVVAGAQMSINTTSLPDDLTRFLVTSLGSKDPSTAEGAAKSLASIGEPGIDILISALKDPDPHNRRVAVDGLGQTGNRRAIEPLISALDDRDHFVRQNAIQALSSFREDRVIMELIAALKDSSPGERGDIAEALVQIGEPAVEPLISALEDQNLDVRRLATFALGKISDSRAVEPLIRLLEGADSLLHSDIIRALIQIEDSRAVGPLGTQLEIEEYAHLRWEIAKALGSMGERAVEPLLLALHDKDEVLRGTASRSLVRIGEPAVEPLVSLFTISQNKETRRLAFNVLATIDSDRAREVLSELGGETLEAVLGLGGQSGSVSDLSQSTENREGRDRLAGP